MRFRANLFPTARLLGLDIDTSHHENNLRTLRHRGAFSKNVPEIHVFDQLQDDSKRMVAILGGQKVDIFIDDGLHSAEAIRNTLKAIKPHLASGFVALIEDVKADALYDIAPFYIRKSNGSIHVLGLND